MNDMEDVSRDDSAPAGMVALAAASSPSALPANPISTAEKKYSSPDEILGKHNCSAQFMQESEQPIEVRSHLVCPCCELFLPVSGHLSDVY